MNHAKRIRALSAEIRKAGLAVLLVATHESDSKNVFYLSGFSGTTGLLAVTPQGATLAVDGRYIARAKREAKAVRIVPVPSPSKEGRLVAHIHAVFEALRIPARARVGFEGERIGVLIASSWQKRFRQRFVPIRGIVERLRGVKDADEIRLIASGCRSTSRAFNDIVHRVHAGMREREVANLIESALKERGALAPSFETIVASGPNSAIPHHATGNRRLRAGEPVIVDFGGIFPGGYVSDMTRTLFVRGKKPSTKFVEIYRIVLEANRRSARALRPGMTWKEYDAVARAYIKEQGYGEYFLHGLGHSLGLEVHDPYDYREIPIRAGTVLTDEPGIYLPGEGGVRIEDDLVVTAHGARLLTSGAYNPVQN